MSCSRRIPPAMFLRTVAAVLLLLLAPEVRAACGSLDFECQVKALESSVKAVASTSNAVSAAIDDLGSGSGNVASDLEKGALAEFETINDDFNQSLRRFSATLDAISNDAFELTTGLIQRIDDGRQVFEHTLEADRHEYEAFLGGQSGSSLTASDAACSQGCEEFRSQMIVMVRNLETTINSTVVFLQMQIEIEGGERLPVEVAPLDLSLLTEVLSRAPGFVLFPLYQGLKAVSATGGHVAACPSGDPACLSLASVNEVFSRVIDSLENVNQMFSPTTYPVPNRFGPRAASGFCRTIFDSDARENTAVIAGWVTQLGGSLLESIGEGMITWAMNEVTVRGGASVAAAGRVGPKMNLLRSAGVGLRAVGGLVKTGGSVWSSTVEACRNDLNHQMTLCLLSEGANSTDGLDQCRQRVLDGDDFGL